MPPPYRSVFLVLVLLACNRSHEGGETSDGATTAHGEPGMCSDATPMSGGPCAPFGVLAAGAHHTCTLLFGGKIRCWGRNRFGELGLGHINPIGDDETPDTSPPLDLGEAVIQISAGLYHTCVVTESGRIYCWGSGKLGNLGHGNTNDIGDDEPASSAGPVPLEGSAVQVVAGHEHTCALMSDGSVYCWGGGQHGHLGTGNTDDIGDDEPVATPIDLGARPVQLSASVDHTCAVLDDGGVICWGFGDRGQLGQGNTENIGDDETPASAGPIDVGAAAVSVVTGAFHTCALTVAGEVRCWGSHGILGYWDPFEDIGDDEPPSAAGAVNLGRPALAIAAGGHTTCALLDNETIKCWGADDFGELGNSGTMDLPSDDRAIEVGGTPVEMAVGSLHVCVLLTDDSIRCWGDGTEGALGYGNTGTSEVEGSPCYVEPGSGQEPCDPDPVCCIGDMPGEMPPPPVPYQ